MGLSKRQDCPWITYFRSGTQMGETIQLIRAGQDMTGNDLETQFVDQALAGNDIVFEVSEKQMEQFDFEGEEDE